jgi:predicted porin
MKNFNMRILRWLIFFALMSPLVVNAADWQIDINGAMRISYNVDECESSCLDLWRSTDPDATSDEESSTYLTGDISQFAINGTRRMDTGFKVVFKTEWRIDSPESEDENIFTSYEQYIGLGGGRRLLRAGTIETPYMQTGLRLDPFYSDALATRFFVDIQSALHHTNGKGRGRSTNTLRYDSAVSSNGLGVQLFTAIDNSSDNDNSYGAGLTYISAALSMFVQYYDNGESGDDEAYKVGWKMGSESFSIFGQYEFDQGLISLSENLSSLSTEDVDTANGDNTYEHNQTTGADVWYLGATYNFGQFMLIYEYGKRKDSVDGREKDDGHTGWILGISLHLDDYFYFYAGYLKKEFNDDNDKDTRYTVGATLTF